MTDHTTHHANCECADALEAKAWELFVAWNQPGEIGIDENDRRFRQYVPIVDCFKAAQDFIDYCNMRRTA